MKVDEITDQHLIGVEFDSGLRKKIIINEINRAQCVPYSTGYYPIQASSQLELIKILSKQDLSKAFIFKNSGQLNKWIDESK